MKVIKQVQSKVMNDVCGIVQSHLHEKGWDVLYRLSLELAPTPNFVEAGNNRDDWMITIHVAPSGKQSLEQLVAHEAMPVGNAWN